MRTLALVVLVQSTLANLSGNDVIVTEKFLSPPKAVADIVLAPRHKNVSYSNLSPDRSLFLVPRSSGLRTMADLAKPHLNLGGLQLDPVANRARSMTTNASAGLDLYDWRSGQSRSIEVPEGVTVSAPEWSPSGNHVAYIGNLPHASHIYVADTKTLKSRQVSKEPLLATSINQLSWVDDGKAIVAVFVPSARPQFFSADVVPTEPKVRVTKPGNNQTRTYASLLETPRDMELLDFYTTGQLGVVEVTSGAMKRIGEPARITRLDAAPSGKHFRVTVLDKPFSYLVPTSSFGATETIWDESGKSVVEISKSQLREGGGGNPNPGPTGPPGAGRGGGQGAGQSGQDKRAYAWRPDGNGMTYLSMEPAPRREEGQEQTPPPRRKDRVMHWLPPFAESDAKVVYESENRIGSVQYSADCKTLFMTETESGQEHQFAVNLDAADKKITIYRRGSDDFYGDNGRLMSTQTSTGQSFVRTSADKRFVYLAGTQYFRNWEEQPPKSFIDRFDLRSGEKSRVFESSAGYSEQPGAILDDDLGEMIVTRQSKYSYPQQFFWRSGTFGRQLTNNEDFAPEVTSARRMRFQVTRVDGFKFWVNVTLPAGFKDGERLPAIFWFYPSEFATQRAYDDSKRTTNVNQFPNVGVRSASLFVTQGYVVVEPDCPIVGPTGRTNDRYVPDLRNSLYAVIDDLDRKGIIDPEKLAIGGHSYGAFSTVNAMVHTPFFKAGIAGDGNYLRMLTPMGFQNESRIFWDARETYVTMSPFFYLEQLNGALLLYHGMDDQNVGTAPINSDRLFHALEGLGKTAALYMYPYEDHGPVTRETHLDLWARWIAWVDKYVKNGDKP